MIVQYERILQAQHELKDYLNGRLELYHTIEHETRFLFTQGSELRREAIRSFELIRQASSDFPTTFHHPRLGEWRDSIEEKKDRPRVRLVIANAFLGELIATGVTFPEEWSEQDKIRFANRYLEELALIEEHINRNSFERTDFMIDGKVAVRLFLKRAFLLRI